VLSSLWDFDMPDKAEPRVVTEGNNLMASAHQAQRDIDAHSARADHR
jgi:hypothetical protein